MYGVLLLLVVLLVGPARSLAQPACSPTVTTKQSVVLRWEAPVAAVGLTLHQYVLEQKMDEGGWMALPPPENSATTQAVSGLVVGRTYTWRLAAQYRDAAGGITQSPYARHAEPPALPPCVSVMVVPMPTGFSATPD